MDTAQRTGATTIAGIASIFTGLAGAAWFYLESTPPRLGFDDTDSPAVSLQFLEGHAIVYAQAGVVLFVMAIALIIASHAVSDALASRTTPVALRVATTFGLLSAALFFMHGVLRLGVQPILYVNGLRDEWGQVAYLVSQFAGIHGFAQGAITALCLWAVGISIIGFRTRTLPTALCILGLVPGFRLVGILGPILKSAGTDELPGGVWILFMASIVGVMVWCVALGVVLVRRAPSAAAEPAA